MNIHNSIAKRRKYSTLQISGNGTTVSGVTDPGQRIGNSVKVKIPGNIFQSFRLKLRAKYTKSINQILHTIHTSYMQVDSTNVVAEGTYKHNNYTQYWATTNTRLTCRVPRFQELTNWRPLRRGRGQQPSCGSHFREYEFIQGPYGYSLQLYETLRISTLFQSALQYD